MSRREVGTEVGISRKLAGFHLDKLVRVGLVALERPSAPLRRPGQVGRRPKRYLPADPGVSVSFPPRRSELLAKVLLRSMAERRPGEEPESAAARVSRDLGLVEGQREKPARSAGMGPERAMAFLRGLLLRLGYDPMQPTDGPLQFRSCPFHPMSTTDSAVVCRIHHAYMAGVVEGLAVPSIEASLIPGTGGCCVELRPDRP
jgi:predicted ArsR family transcriptional regulator